MQYSYYYAEQLGTTAKHEEHTVKYDTEDGSTVETNVSGGRTSEMGIDLSALPHVLSVLTDLYESPVEAVIREYATNARDAHKEVGNDAPIKVYLPSEHSPVYEVVDTGVGMSEDTLHDVFSLYGASTKRDSDDFNGMLGLGCKAALTYTPQFVLVSVKDGIKSRAIIIRQPSGVPSITTKTSATDEPNGTSVQVPVIDVDAFNDRARTFFSYWERGTVLVNGEEPSPIWENENVIQLDDDVLLIPSGVHGGNTIVRVVMGDVAYPLDYSHSNKVTEPLAHGATVIARVRIGEASLTPNREALRYTPKTEAMVAVLADYVKEATERRFNERIVDAPTAGAAMAIAAEARQVMWRFNATWQGKAVPIRISVAGRGRYGRHDAQASYGIEWTDGDLHVSTANDLDTQSKTLRPDRTTLVITNYTNVSVSNVNKAKVQQWSEENLDDNPRLVLFRPAKSKSLTLWMDDSPNLHFADWDDVKGVNLTDRLSRAVRPARASTSGPSTAAPSDDLSEVRRVQTDGEYRVVTREAVLEWDKVVMIAPSDMKKVDRGHLARRLEVFGGYLIVVNMSRQDEALEVFTNLTTEEEIVSSGTRARFDALDVTLLAHHRETQYSDEWGSSLRTADTFLREANRRGPFGQHHRVLSVRAIVDKFNRSEKEHIKLRRLYSDLQSTGAEVPVYVKAMWGWACETLPESLRIDLNAPIAHHIRAFKAAFPLYDILSNGDQAAEYLRLLGAAGEL